MVRTQRPAGFRDRVEALYLSGRDIVAISGVQAVRGGRDYLLIRCPAPEHEDRNPSCSVNLTTGRAKCFSCGWSAGDIVALHRELAGFPSMGEALRDLETRHGGSIPPLRLQPAPMRGSSSGATPEGEAVTVATWSYTEADGTPAFDVIRIQYRLPDGSWWRKPGKAKPHKTYLQTHPGGSPSGLPTPYRDGKRRPLYRARDIVNAPTDAVIYVVEGERAADALRDVGVLATTSSGGAKNARHSDWSLLAGCHVVVWPDNDPAGEQYAIEVLGLLRPLELTPSVEVVDVAELELPVGGDAVDWLAQQEGDR